MIYFENRVGAQFHVKTIKQKTSNADRTNINQDRIENFFCFLQLFCIPYLPSMYRLQVFRNSFLEVCRIWWHWEIFCQTFCWVFSFAAICRFPLSGYQLLLVWGLPSNILKTHYSREPVKSEWAGSWHTRNWFGELAVTWLLWILFVCICLCWILWGQWLDLSNAGLIREQENAFSGWGSVSGSSQTNSAVCVELCSCCTV